MQKQWVLGLGAAWLALVSPFASASVFYKLTVAQDAAASGLTGFGPAPSINDKGKVAYVTKSASGDSLSVWLPGRGAFEISPGFRSTSRTFGDSALINNNDEVVVWNRRSGALGLVSEVRVFRSRQADDSTVVAHALSGVFQYDTLFQYPTIDNSLALKDQFVGANSDGLCDNQSGVGCFSRVAFGAFVASPLARYLSMTVKNPIRSSENNPSSGTYNQYTLVSTAARPQMTDDGRVVVRANLPTSPIQLLTYDAPQRTENVASTADGFVSFGVAPGVTPDGRIVAFAGSRGAGGDGIFLSIYDPTVNSRRIVRIAGENGVIQKPELGFDGQQNPLFFQAIQVDSRVGIIYTPDANGNANKSVVVSFIGTPNAASRINPSTGKPFTFTAQPGLFTIRIDLGFSSYRDSLGNAVCVAKARPTSILPFTKGDDIVIPASTVTDDDHAAFIAPGPNGICESDNNDDSEALLSRSSPIPVVQIGDVIFSGSTTYTISALSVNGPLAQANFDGTFAPRQARVGDHRVAFWAQAGTNQLIVTGEHLDSDQDGLFDHWETGGISVDGGNIVDLNLAAMGANPFQRDLFLQLDWTNDRVEVGKTIHYEPLPGAVSKVVDFFASAPALPNGIPAGITAHIDGGTGFDRTGVAFSRNMNSGTLRGGNGIGGTVDVLYFGRPGSVTIPNVSTVSFDNTKANRVWQFDRGAREFAFRYAVLTGFHQGYPDDSSTIVGQVTGGVTPFCFVDSNNADFDFDFGPTGASVLIAAGTGQGQVRRIAPKLVTDPPRSLCVMNDRPWTTLPDTTSKYALLDGHSGVSAPPSRTDNSTAPGSNLIVSLGSNRAVTMAGFPNDLFVGPGLQQANTLVHELGHLFGLLHGGTNHINYKPTFGSIMNYGYSGCRSGVGKFSDGTNFPSGLPCPLFDYGKGTSPVNDFFDGWANLDLKASTSLGALGNAFGPVPSAAPGLITPTPEPTAYDQERIFGLPDVLGPTVTVQSPVANAAVTLGNSIPVTIDATDNESVTAARIYFDVNGDGTIDLNTEGFAATRGAGSVWTATVPSVSGPAGQRILIAIAEDGSLNSGVQRVTLNVGSIAQVTVPNVVGLTQAAAVNAITAAGLTVGTITQQSSATVPAGNVISENPAAGSSVAAGSAVNLVVSSGVALVTVPNVVGLTQAAAVNAITAAGLTVGTITQQSSATVPAGNVISENPAAGSSVAAGSAVNLVVSSGVALVTVPNVVGLTQAAAVNAITSSGLTVGTITQQNSATVPAGNVISENPAAGSSVAAGSAVNLVVSRGALTGDLNGDGVVNCADIAIVKASFNKRTGQPGFDARADVNRDGVVNVIDLSTVARQLPVGTTCN